VKSGGVHKVVVEVFWVGFSLTRLRYRCRSVRGGGVGN
jgi:hypothetical protein